MMMREATNPTISPLAEVLEPSSFFPPETATVCPFPRWNVCRCAAACVAAVPAPVHTSAVVRPSQGARLSCAEPWLGLGREVALPGACGVLHSTMVFAWPQIKGAKKLPCRHDVLVESRGKCCHGWKTSHVLHVLSTGIFAHPGCISHWVMFTVAILYSSPFTELCTREHWHFCVLPVAHGSLEVF